MRRTYVPERGDAVWLDFDPQIGHEQQGRRPALVLSPAAYNAKAGLAVFVPITNQAKGYTFEVPIPKGQRVSGVVLADQLKSLDWDGRKVQRICKLPDQLHQDVVLKSVSLIDPEE